MHPTQVRGAPAVLPPARRPCQVGLSGQTGCRTRGTLARVISGQPRQPAPNRRQNSRFCTPQTARRHAALPALIGGYRVHGGPSAITPLTCAVRDIQVPQRPGQAHKLWIHDLPRVARLDDEGQR
jgi:hypothetical protein